MRFCLPTERSLRSPALRLRAERRCIGHRLATLVQHAKTDAMANDETTLSAKTMISLLRDSHANAPRNE